jgi:hypothetical protein
VQRLNFPEVTKAICTYIDLPAKELIITWPYQSLATTTFKAFDGWHVGTNPSWFAAYNNVKHDRIGNAKDANFGNVIHAVGGLFILNLWLREQDIRKDCEHINLLDRRLRSYSTFFSPERFLNRTGGGNLDNLVFL